MGGQPRQSRTRPQHPRTHWCGMVAAGCLHPVWVLVRQHACSHAVRGFQGNVVHGNKPHTAAAQQQHREEHARPITHMPAGTACWQAPAAAAHVVKHSCRWSTRPIHLQPLNDTPAARHTWGHTVANTTQEVVQMWLPSMVASSSWLLSKLWSCLGRYNPQMCGGYDGDRGRLLHQVWAGGHPDRQPVQRTGAQHQQHVHQTWGVYPVPWAAGH